MRIKSKRILIYGLIFLLSLFFVSSSVFIFQEVHNKKELSKVELGLPLKFLEQNQSHYDPPFPIKVRLYSPWENPTNISWIRFSFSVVIVFILVSLILNILVKLFRMFQK